MRGLNTTRPAGNSATATAPVTPADSKFLLILFLPYNKLSIWYVGSRTSEPSKANLCNRRSVVGQSKVVKYLKFGRMLRIRVLPNCNSPPWGLKLFQEQLFFTDYFLILPFGTHYASITELGTKLSIERRYSAKVLS